MTNMFIDHLGSILTGAAALGAMVVSWLNGRKIKEIHVQINSRMDELLRLAGLLGQAQGRAEEVTRAAEKLAAKVEEVKNGRSHEQRPSSQDSASS